ncbi:hypothetical protein LCGC14_1457730 [marine sediment metagenome]|uniref:Uncharacterized protein n=1 Tax=marine sediment metagenome TaxID=412755 RepID=A0A0F9LWK0_9ZZZZ
MYRPISGCQSRCYIVNEAHGLTKEQVRKLLKITEAPYLNENMTWIFTTTLEGQVTFEDGKQDAGPLLSRCMDLELKESDAEIPMAMRLKNIAVAENLDSQEQELPAYLTLLTECKSNMRAAIQQIERGVMLRTDVATSADAAETTPESAATA